MNLAVPIFIDEKIYDTIEIKKPKTGIITLSYEAAQKGNIFKAMVELIAGCTESIMSVDGEVIDNPAQIKRLCGAMPYIAAEAVALKVMVMVNEDDFVEGLYTCPRCGTKIMAEYDKELEIDNRDKISDLEIKCMEKADYHNAIPVILSDTIKLTNVRTGEALYSIDNFEIRHPTLNDCIISCQNMQDGQEVRVQIKIYINSLISINGKPIEKKWIGTWGKLLFDNIEPRDLKQIGKELQKYGIDKMIERACHKCGKVWEAAINTSNFFALGLQPQ